MKNGRAEQTVPTYAQAEVLEALKAGAILAYNQLVMPSPTFNRSRVQWATIHRLCALGWIDGSDEHRTGENITDAGKAALKRKREC